LAALSDYVIYVLEKHRTIELSKILSETDSKYDEIGPIINELATIKEGICTMRSFPNTRLLGKLSEAQIKIAKDTWNMLS
jgi:hypothetical protein